MDKTRQFATTPYQSSAGLTLMSPFKMESSTAGSDACAFDTAFHQHSHGVPHHHHLQQQQQQQQQQCYGEDHTMHHQMTADRVGLYVHITSTKL